MYETNMAELQSLNQVLRDEHQALQIAFAAIEDKLRKAQVHILYIILFVIKIFHSGVAVSLVTRRTLLLSRTCIYKCGALMAPFLERRCSSVNLKVNVDVGLYTFDRDWLLFLLSLQLHKQKSVKLIQTFAK